MAKLSVIMISYNEAQYLKEAFDSVLNQSFKDIEIIVIDDGSNDDSIKIIDDYKNKNPKIIKSFVQKRDDGEIVPSVRVSNNIKFALSKATGEYFVVLSGDDYFCDLNKFKDDIEFLEFYKKYIATVSDFVFKYEDREDKIHNYNNRKCFWSGKYAHISCFTFRKKVIDNLLKIFCDDTGFIYSIMVTGKWKYTNKVSFAYRQRPKSIVRKSSENQLYMLELLLLEDILFSKKKVRTYKLSTLARFYNPLFKLKENRQEVIQNISDYKTIFDLESRICENKSQIISDIINFDNLKFAKKQKLKKLLFLAKFGKFWYHHVDKIENLFLNKGDVDGNKEN